MKYDIKYGTDLTDDQITKSWGKELLDFLPDSLAGKLALAGGLGMVAVSAMTYHPAPDSTQANAIRHAQDSKLSQMASSPASEAATPTITFTVPEGNTPVPTQGGGEVPPPPTSAR